MNTASHKEDIPNNSYPKIFFQLVCVSRKIESCEKKWKMALSLRGQFNQTPRVAIDYHAGRVVVLPSDGP
jgi:hypothetical protein